MMKPAIIVLFLILLPISFGELSGTINVGNVSNFVTGLHGSTVSYCNSTVDCMDSNYYKCLVDYDSESLAGSTGWCALSGQTSCAHFSASSSTYTNTTGGSGLCINGTAYRVCSSGTWGNVVNCDAQICKDGSCQAPASGSSSSSSSIITTNNVSFIRIQHFSTSLAFVQGDNSSIVINVTNGNTTQRNVSLSLTGISGNWYSILPSVVPIIYMQSNVSFVLNFSIPSNATVGIYNLMLNVSTSNSSVSDSFGFTVTINPSPRTIENDFKPSATRFEDRLKYLKSRFETENSSLDAVQSKKIQNLIKVTDDKITQAQDYLDRKMYSEFNTLSPEIQELLDEIESLLGQPKPVQQSNDMLFTVILVAVIGAAAAFIFFLARPVKEQGYTRDNGYLITDQKKKKNVKFLNNVFKSIGKKKKEENFFEERKK